MGFGAQLESLIVEEWRGSYVDYRKLSKLLHKLLPKESKKSSSRRAKAHEGTPLLPSHASPQEFDVSTPSSYQSTAVTVDTLHVDRDQARQLGFLKSTPFPKQDVCLQFVQRFCKVSSYLHLYT